MRPLTLKTLPCLVAATLLLGSVPAWAQQNPMMNGDPDATWQRHPDGTTTGWQGDRPQPAQEPAMQPGDDQQQWARQHHQHEDDAMRTHREGDVTFVSGGVGLDESHALLREGRHYPLMLTFLGNNREYLSDVRVRIASDSDDDVLVTHAQGPYLLAKLPSGRYTVHVSYHGREQTRRIAVSANGHVRSTFVWPTRDD